MVINEQEGCRYPGSVCQQGGAASSFPQQLLGVIVLFLLVLFIVVLETHRKTVQQASFLHLFSSKVVKNRNIV